MTVLIPTSLADALDALADHPAADVLAGGTDLMVEVNEGRRRPEAVVVVNRVPELRTWEHDPIASTVRLGAAVTYDEILREPLCSLLPALAQAARTVGSPQIRHAATIGGNVATASPAGDGLPVLAAVDAVVHLVSRAGRRDVPFTEFMTGPKRTVLGPGELIEAVTVPVLDGWQGYAKVGVRNAMVIAIASACLAVDRPSGTVRLALGSVGPVIIRCTEAEALAAVDPTAVTRFAELAAAAARPIDDHRATAAYRRHAVGVLAGRLLRRAFSDE
jgi:CO/xanthine dehydrogenase FAD-binding subunit